LSLRPKPEIEKLKICPHGGKNYTELKEIGLTPEAVIDFSVCTNPFMPPPGVKEILATIAIEQYPDSEATELRQCLAERLEVSTNNIIVGSGTTELIRLIALAYFRPGDCVLILEPTFGEYEVAVRIMGAEPLKQWTGIEDDFTLHMVETVGIIREHCPRGIFICNPNNPTGKYLSRQEIEMILAAIGDGLLIIDEAYVAFVEQNWSATDLAAQGNVVILRSMTKDYGLAGLRLGYAVASQEIIDNLRRVCPPWNVNIIAQKTGVAALEATDYLNQSKKKIREAKQFLVDGLSQLGFPVLPSDTHYFLVRVGDAPVFRTALLRHGILVRDCTSFGLPEYIRIAPRTMPECQKLITAITNVYQPR